MKNEAIFFANVVDDLKKWPPSFIFCPASGTYFPEGNTTEIVIEWQTPEATDQDGEVSR